MKNPIHSHDGKAFRRIFKRSVLEFWDVRFGFDIVKLDDWLQVPVSRSTRDEVEARYGSEAVSVVERLIQADPLAGIKDNPRKNLTASLIQTMRVIK
jgi:hypothetical protein